MNIEVYEIKWEVEDEDHDLPSEAWVTNAYPNNYILNHDDVMNILDEVSDRYGYPIEDAKVMCHNTKHNNY